MCFNTLRDKKKCFLLQPLPCKKKTNVHLRKLKKYKLKIFGERPSPPELHQFTPMRGEPFTEHGFTFGSTLCR